MTHHVCFHGAESTGKSMLAPRLALRLGGLVVPEYGRTYAEANGTDLDDIDLLAIFDGHCAATKEALAQKPDWLISDTDALMTQAWAIMLLGRRLPEIDLWEDVADLYLVPAMDLEWLEDGTRLFGSAEDRAAFAAQARQVLVDAGVPFRTIFGTWEEREAEVRACIADVIATGAA